MSRMPLLFLIFLLAFSFFFSSFRASSSNVSEFAGDVSGTAALKGYFAFLQPGEASSLVTDSADVAAAELIIVGVSSGFASSEGSSLSVSVSCIGVGVMTPFSWPSRAW